MTREDGTPDDGAPLVALTGASGFLGSHIADALLAAGFAVRVALRPTSDRRWLDGKPLDIHETDLLSTASCARLLRGARAVIHCAGVVSGTDEAGFTRGNVDTTRALAEAARTELPAAAGAFLLVSSLAAHGPAGPGSPAREGAPERPISPYGRSKLAAERVLAEAALPLRCVILRPPALYGPRDRGFLPLLKAARRGWTAWFGGRLQAVSLVDGRDCARAAVALLQSPQAKGTYFVDDGRGGYDKRALTDALAAAVDRRVHCLTVPPALLRLAARLTGGWRPGRAAVLAEDRIRDLEVDGWVCDGSRLVRETGFRAEHDAARGLRDALAFYREQEWL